MLSPLLRCLTVDNLISRLNRGGVHTLGYANDMSAGNGKIPKHGVRAIEVWCSNTRLLINSDKTNLRFMRKGRLLGFLTRLFPRSYSASFYVSQVSWGEPGLSADLEEACE